MKLFRVSGIALMLFMLLISAAGVYAQQGNGASPPPAAAGLCTDGQYLFVVAGDTMYQYSAEDLSLVTTVALPKLASPTDSDNQTQSPPPPAGSGICTDGTYLFMLRGHSIQQYTVAYMTLVNSVELPKPEPPTNTD